MGFTADRIDQKWVSQLTYIQTKEGWLYLTVLIDLYYRKVIGWFFSNGMSALETAMPAWRMALLNLQISKELFFH